MVLKYIFKQNECLHVLIVNKYKYLYGSFHFILSWEIQRNSGHVARLMFGMFAPKEKQF